MESFLLGKTWPIKHFPILAQQEIISFLCFPLTLQKLSISMETGNSTFPISLVFPSQRLPRPPIKPPPSPHSIFPISTPPPCPQPPRHRPPFPAQKRSPGALLEPPHRPAPPPQAPTPSSATPTLAGDLAPSPEQPSTSPSPSCHLYLTYR